MQKIICLDRDGTINKLIHRKGYPEPTPPWAPKECSITADVILAMKAFLAMGFRLAILTNQPDAAKQNVGIKKLLDVKTALMKQLENNGITLSHYEACYHHPEGTLKSLAVECRCRKPNVSMLEKIFEAGDYRKADSWMIGDSASDIAAGNTFGLQTIGLPSVNDAKCTSSANASFLASGLLDCVEIIRRNK